VIDRCALEVWEFAHHPRSSLAPGERPAYSTSHTVGTPEA
jgi:hypothetical protein